MVSETLKLIHSTLLSGHQKGNTKGGAKEQNDYLLPVGLAKVKALCLLGPSLDFVGPEIGQLVAPTHGQQSCSRSV